MNEANQKRTYILDTNALIQFSVWLPIDLNKNFWRKLEEALQNNQWVLLNIVVNEIKYSNDGLKEWCKKQKNFMSNINDLHKERAAIINNSYKMIDETTGKSTGDTYLIAYAESQKLTVFSREAPRKNSNELYKIPDVCSILNIPIIHRPKEFIESIGYKN
jgi:hypothetical protein